MAPVQFVATKHSGFGSGRLPPSRRPVGHIKLALSALLVGAVAIGLLVAVFVLGSIVAAVLLVSSIVFLATFVIKMLLGPPRPG